MTLYRYAIRLKVREYFDDGVDEPQLDPVAFDTKTNVTANSQEQARRNAIHYALETGRVVVSFLSVRRTDRIV